MSTNWHKAYHMNRQLMQARVTEAELHRLASLAPKKLSRTRNVGAAFWHRLLALPGVLPAFDRAEHKQRRARQAPM